MVRKNQTISDVSLTASAIGAFACVAFTAYSLTSLPSYATGNYAEGIVYEIEENPDLNPHRCPNRISGRLCLTPIQ